MSKISELSDGGALQSTDYLIVVRSGGNVKVQANGAVSGTTGQFSTSLNVDGTVTADGLTVTKAAGDIATLEGTGVTADVQANLVFNPVFDVTARIVSAREGAALASTLSFETGVDNTGSTVKRQLISSNGDISFYEDTGTTAKFFWDASAEALGLGTSSPDFTLDVAGVITRERSSSGSTASPVTDQVVGLNAGGNFAAGVTAINTNSSNFDVSLGFVTRNASGDGVERVRIDADGNVGIGTSTINERLVLGSADSGSNFLQITNSTTTAANDRGFYVGIDANEAARIIQRENADMVFSTNNTEAMRIDSSGNVGIGTTPSYFVDAYRDANDNAPTLALRNPNAGASAASRMYMEANGNNFNIYVNGDGTANANITQFRSTAGGGQFTFETASQEAMRIDSSGRVGIGTSSPTTALTVAASGASGIELDPDASATTDSGRLFFSTSAGSNAIFSSSGNLRFTTGATAGAGSGTERMRLDASGNLLVGTTDDTPVSPGTLSGASIRSGGQIQASSSSDSPLYLNRFTTTGKLVGIRYAGVDVGSIDVTASATSYVTSSDARLKENIADAGDAGAKVDAIQVRQFDWKADGSHQDYGMIAQELLTVAPEAVSGDPESDDMMGVDYSKLVPMLVKEIQSLRARVAQLEGA